MRKHLLLPTSIALLCAAAYLLVWPVRVEPQRWTPGPDPGLRGPYAANDALGAVERLAPDELPGPAGIAVDAEGQLYTGVADGRILRLNPADGGVTALAVSGGRPLGLLRTAGDGFVVADAVQGLVAARKRNASVLSAESGGVPFRYANGVALAPAPDGGIYFTDSSSKFGQGQTWADFVEHGANGRLLRYDEATRRTQTALSGLHFPAGLAPAADGRALLVCEASEYRVLRYWLAGDKAGRAEPFLENLPGFPFAVSWNGRDTYWIALYAPRIARLDAWADRPWLRTLMFRLPRAWQPRPARHSFVLGVSEAGRIVHNLQFAGEDAYAPITGAIEHAGWLYFGSVTDRGIGRIRVPR